MLKAQHTHDCDSCHLIGKQYHEDVYYCPSEGSIVRRFGSDGPDYSSFPMSIARVAGQDHPEWAVPVALAEAYLVGRTV